MPDKSDEGAWAVVRYLPFNTNEGELPAHIDCWFANRDAAEAVAKDWASEYPEATVVVVVQPNRYSVPEENNRTAKKGLRLFGRE